jgi:AcrR family transcriptional regulator
VGAEEDRAAQLLAAASQLFAQRGYEATSVNDIAGAVGITGAAMYRHFRGKQDLLGQVLLAELDGLTEMVETTIARNATAAPAERIHTLATAAAALAVERRALSAIWRWESAHLDRATRNLVRRRGAVLTGRCAAALRGCRPQLSTQDARRLAWGTMSVLGSVADHRVTPAKGHFTATLAGIAERVLRVKLPAEEERDHAARSLGALEIAPSRRQQILSEATRLFAQRGYRAVSMEDIGAAVGLAAPSVYRHYSSKDEILLLAARGMGARLMINASEVLARHREPSVAMRAIVASYVETMTGFRDLVAVYVRDVGYLPRAGRAELLGMQRDYVAQWVELLRAADPARSQQAARIAVHAALAVVNDLSRGSWVESGRIRRSDLVAMATAALGLTAGRDCGSS